MEFRRLLPEQLTPAQFEQIVSIEENCGLEPYTRDMLMECIRDLDTYVCMDADTVAGFITILAASRRSAGGLYIVNLNVAGDYRRRGLAQRLILTACSCYKETHAGRFVILDVAKTNTAAWHLYKKLGFSVTDIPSQNGPTDVVMMTRLDCLLRKTNS